MAGLSLVFGRVTALRSGASPLGRARRRRRRRPDAERAAAPDRRARDPADGRVLGRPGRAGVLRAGERGRRGDGRDRRRSPCRGGRVRCWSPTWRPCFAGWGSSVKISPCRTSPSAGSRASRWTPRTVAGLAALRADIAALHRIARSRAARARSRRRRRRRDRVDAASRDATGAPPARRHRASRARADARSRHGAGGALSLRRSGRSARSTSSRRSLDTALELLAEMRDAAGEHAGRSSRAQPPHARRTRGVTATSSAPPADAGEAAQHGAKLRAHRRGHPRVATPRPRSTEAHRALPRCRTGGRRVQRARSGSPTSCRTCSARARSPRRSFRSTRRCSREGDEEEADRVAGAVGALLALVRRDPRARSASLAAPARREASSRRASRASSAS